MGKIALMLLLKKERKYAASIPIFLLNVVSHIFWMFLLSLNHLVMPAMATVFDKKCNPLLELGTGPYNTIRWNPLGNCILYLVNK